MKLIITWKDKKTWGEAETAFPNVDPKTISMNYDILTFGTEGYQKHWSHNMAHIKSFQFAEETAEA